MGFSLHSYSEETACVLGHPLLRQQLLGQQLLGLVPTALVLGTSALDQITDSFSSSVRRTVTATKSPTE